MTFKERLQISLLRFSNLDSPINDEDCSNAVEAIEMCLKMMDVIEKFDPYFYPDKYPDVVEPQEIVDPKTNPFYPEM